MERVGKSFDSKASIWWRDLCVSCGGASESKWVDKRIKWHVGEGNQARFWLDNWGMNLLLRTNFLDYFSFP